jgi:hypothetical protein
MPCMSMIFDHTNAFSIGRNCSLEIEYDEQRVFNHGERGWVRYERRRLKKTATNKGYTHSESESRSQTEVSISCVSAS